MRRKRRPAAPVDSFPFRAWLAHYMDLYGLDTSDVARRCDVDEAAVRRWLGRKPDSLEEISLWVVDLVATKLAGDPGVLEDLYPLEKVAA